MYRYETKRACVRFNGLETRVAVRHGEAGKGMSKRALRKLIDVLYSALLERERYDAITKMHAKDGTGRCAAIESAGVQCEKERGHDGPHTCDDSLGRFMASRGA